MQSIHHVSCGFDVHAFEGLIPNFADDPDQMNGRITSGKGTLKMAQVQNGTLNPNNTPLRGGGSSTVHDHLMPIPDQRVDQCCSNKAGSSGYEDFHSVNLARNSPQPKPHNR